MPIDLRRFQEGFFDEASELLQTLEERLLALDVHREPDREELDTIFRAAHSIKGGSATFGFAEIAEFTHEVEAVLDAMRRGQLAPSSRLVSALLEAVDVVRDMVAAHRAGETPDRSLSSAVSAQLQSFVTAAPKATETFGFFEETAEPEEGERQERAPVSAEPLSLRVSLDKVDKLVNLMGELVVAQSRLSNSAEAFVGMEFEHLHASVKELERHTRDLREGVMAIRMVPMGTIFGRFARLVRDLSSKFEKDVQLRTSGDDIELDKGLIEQIVDPLTHLIRNAFDHGVESPDERIAAGKPATGTIELRASHEGGNVVIAVTDDGRGLDREKILRKARDLGIDVNDDMSDADVWQLTFLPGFSTAAQITDLSGRGVGMDVVRRNISSLGGSVELSSAAGVGTRVSIRLPLTLAIVDGLSVAVGDASYIIPLTSIVESLQPERTAVQSIAPGCDVLYFRGEPLRIIPLRDVLQPGAATLAYEQGIVVVVESNGKRRALFVDRLENQHQVVVKSLEANFRRVPHFSGACVLGDGSVAFILDVASFAEGAGSGLREAVTA